MHRITTVLPAMYTCAYIDHQVRHQIGYCPQFGALLERLSGRELLTMFGRLRGIQESVLKSAVESELKRMDLVEHADKQCGKYR